MKVLFLDIDGVMNYEGTNNKICPKAVAILNRIISETKAKIVLSSVWRLSETMRKEVRDAGVDFIGITPYLPKEERMSSVGRGLEINAWLKDHPEVTKYAILDDDSDFLPDQPLFQTTWEKGLTEDIANEVIKHLNK